jgi:hypothetical protein
MKTLIVTLVFLVGSSVFAGNGKFKDSLMVWSLDLPDSSSVSQMAQDCENRGTQLKAVLSKIAGNLKTPQEKLSMYTELYMYDPSNMGMTNSYVCSLFLESADPQIGFRFVRDPIHRGKDYLAQCKADSDSLTANQNILMVQTDAAWDLLSGKKCQTFGVEVGQR